MSATDPDDGVRREFGPAAAETFLRQRDKAIAERDDARDAARILAAARDGSLLYEDTEVDDLFDRGLIRSVRDYTDEYHAEMTPEGEALVRRVVNAPILTEGQET
jgi:hypothetical protein